MIGSNFTEVIEMTGTFFLPESSFDAGPQWIATLIGVIFSKSVVHFIWKLSIQRRVHWTHAENVRSKENSTSINYQESNKYFWWGWTDRQSNNRRYSALLSSIKRNRNTCIVYSLSYKKYFLKIRNPLVRWSMSDDKHHEWLELLSATTRNTRLLVSVVLTKSLYWEFSARYM